MKVITDAAPKKRKRFNKNKKKAWRKKINIDDIEDHLEEKRREERLGGPLEERVSSDLFNLDFGENDNKKLNFKRKHAIHFTSNDDGLKPLFNKQEKKILRCHQFINGLPGAKAISVKRGITKQKEKRVIKFSKKLASGTPAAEVKKRLLMRQRKVDLKRKCSIQKPDFDRNLWGASPIIEDKFDEVAKTYVTEPILYYKAQTKQLKIKTPSVRFVKPTLLPSVVIPKAGASYNPSYDDHQKLLAEALQVEKEKQKKEEKEKRMRVKYAPPTNRGITELERMAEITEGLPLDPNQDYEMLNFSDEEKEEEEESEEGQNYVSNKKVEKRSMQSRKKEKTLKIMEQKRLKVKERKRRENDINRLKSLQKNIAEEENEYHQLQEKKKLKKLKDRYRTKRLSLNQFEDNDDEIPLGNELAESLRTLEPVGNPLESVFKSLQRRNIIEMPGKGRRTKAKKKMIRKKSCREPLNHLLNDPE